MKNKYKFGDVVQHKTFEEHKRIILGIYEDSYSYIDYNNEKMFFNPTNSSVSIKAMQDNYTKKVGFIKNLNTLADTMTKGIKETNIAIGNLTIELEKIEINELLT